MLKRNLELLLCLLFLASLAHATLPPTGMAKPVADLKDYDATYGGSPGTGTIGYTTLYRDNEDGGATSGCNGEGCGAHPGIDIPVPSGTAVYSAYSGTVVFARCMTNGWGGLVTIQSTTPHGETVYFSYAHLRNWSYFSEGAFVGIGVHIGDSGGGSGDVCHGNSTGAHVHFQVDKTNHSIANGPWFPSNVNAADSGFAVIQNTYNPIAYVTAGFRWSFEQAGNPEYWTASNVANWGVGGGALWIDGNLDPHIQRSGNVSCAMSHPCSASFAADASLLQYVDLNVNNTCLNNPGKIYFTTASSPGWDEAKAVQYTAISGAQQIHIWMGSNSLWSGVITQLRVDPAVGCTTGAYDPNFFNEITIQW